MRPSTTVSLVMRLAALIEAMGTLYFELSPDKVSPATTVWITADPLAGGAAGTGAAAGGAAGTAVALVTGGVDAGAPGTAGVTAAELSSYAAGVS